LSRNLTPVGSDAVFNSQKFSAQAEVRILKGVAFWPVLITGEPEISEEKKTELIETAVQMFLATYAA
jgi:hypothetical protein